MAVGVATGRGVGAATSTAVTTMEGWKEVSSLSVQDLRAPSRSNSAESSLGVRGAIKAASVVVIVVLVYEK